MKKVYSFLRKIVENEDYAKLANRLSLDTSKPSRGLSPAFGLLGSDEWLQNIERGTFKKNTYEGVIEELYYAGMDSDRTPNSFRFTDQNGNEWNESMRVNSKTDENLYKVGARIKIIIISLPMKDGNLFERPFEIYLG